MSEYLFRTKYPIMTCQECPIVKKNGSGTICPLKEGAERRYGTCPLKELPTHGDLVEKTELSNALLIENSKGEKFFAIEVEDYNKIPVVIPASEGE